MLGIIGAMTEEVLHLKEAMEEWRSAPLLPWIFTRED